MQRFSVISSKAIPLGLNNIDTDAIIPAKYLKTISRTGLGAGLFEALRQTPGNMFDDPRYAGAQVLIAGDNFGCGSSREHAAWALNDFGIRVVIAPGFSDIFSGNAFKNGILTVVLPQSQIAELCSLAEESGITVDLEQQHVIAGNVKYPFSIDPFRKHCLLGGLDEIELTLSGSAEIAAHEKMLAQTQPWLSA